MKKQPDKASELPPEIAEKYRRFQRLVASGASSPEADALAIELAPYFHDQLGEVAVEREKRRR